MPSSEKLDVPVRLKIADKIFLGILICFAVLSLRAWMSILTTGDLYVADLARSNLMIDFVKLYSGAKIIVAGEGKQIYDPDVQLAQMNQTVQPNRYPIRKYAQYPPYDFLLATPLTALPLMSAYALWCAGTLLLGLIGIVYFRHVVGGSLAFSDVLALALLYFNSLFSMDSIMIGQTAWLMLGVVSVFFAAFYKRQNFLAGFMLALSTIKPQFLFCLLPGVLMERRWRLIFYASLFELCLLVASIFFVGWTNIVDYPHVLAHAEAQMFGRDDVYMACLRGLLTSLLGEQLGFYSSFLPVVVGLALMVYAWYPRSKSSLLAPDSPHFNVAVSASVLVYLVCSPHTFLYDCLLLAIPALLLLRKVSPEFILQKTGSEKYWQFFLLLLPVLAWVPYLYSKLLGTRFILISNIVLIAVLLWPGKNAFNKNASEDT
jgi:Glycosyltransferase family 87